MSEREYTCIVCPLSCRLTVAETDAGINVEGYSCVRGKRFGIAEHTAPTRMLTSTVRIEGALFPRLPVVSSGEVPRDKLRDCLAEVYRTTIKAPVMRGDVVIENVCGTGVDIVSSRTMPAAGPDF